VGRRRVNRERKEERKRDRRVGAGKEVTFSGLTVGTLYCGPDPLRCEGTCGNTGQCLRFRSL
jgi:hypothetical protein